MTEINTNEQLVESIRKNVATWLETIIPLLRQAPTSPTFPSSVMLLAPVHQSSGSPLAWIKTIEMTTPEHPDGWLHAMQLSRDLLLLLAQLDIDFQLGIPGIANLVAGHPLLRDLTVTMVQDRPGREVMDFVEDRGVIGDGNG